MKSLKKPLLIVFVATLLFAVAFVRNEAEYVASARKQIRDAGEPLDRIQLKEYSDSKTTKNASTKELMLILKRLAGLKLDDEKLDIPHANQLVIADWTNAESAREFLELWSSELERLIAISSQFANARFPIDYSQYPFASSPEFKGYGNAVRLVLLDGYLKAFDGKRELAMQRFQLLRALTNVQFQQPHFLTPMMRIFAIGRSRQLALVLAERFSGDDKFLSDLQLGMLDPDAAEAWKSAWIADRAITCDLFNSRPDPFFKVIHQSAYLQFAALVNKGFESPELSWHLSFSEAEAERSDYYRYPWRLVYPVFGKVMSMPHGVVMADSEVRGHAGVLAIAAVRQLMSTGAKPSLVADIQPKFLPPNWNENWRNDPFVPSDSNAEIPLRMVSHNRELLIYSIGNDGSDDNGRFSPQRDGGIDVGALIRLPELAE